MSNTVVKVMKRMFSPKCRNQIGAKIDITFGNLLRKYHGILNGHKTTISTWWCPGTKNFGDIITTLLLERSKIISRLSLSADLQLSCVGSILEMLPQGFHGTIFGSGFMFQDSVRDFSDSQVLAVRGKLTRDRLGQPTLLVGDPGLLLRDVYTARQEKRFVLGLIPHWREYDDPRLTAIRDRYPDKIKIIDVCDIGRKGRFIGEGVLRVVKQIDECEYIISSSLHGLIMADMLGIPNRWTALSNRCEGNGYKFRDYYSAFDEQREFLSIQGDETLSTLLKETVPPPEKLTVVTEQLKEAWKKMLTQWKTA